MKLRIGIIGFGGAGTAHYRYYSRIANCAVVKIFDVKEEAHKRAAALCPTVPVLYDLKEFWKDLDAISICSPDSTHANYIAEAVQNGIHVICEKPLSDSVEGIRKIKKAEQNSKCVIAVLQQMRFIPIYRKIKALIENKQIGPISYIEANYIHNLMQRAYVFDDWREKDNATPLMYAGCHFVDLLRWLVDGEITEVYAVANHLAFPAYPESDMNAACLKFANGTIGQVMITFGSACPSDHPIRIYGQLGVVENSLFFDNKGNRKTIHSHPLIQKQLLHPTDYFQRARDFLKELKTNFPGYLSGKVFELLRGHYFVRYYPWWIYEHELACIDAIRDFTEAIRDSRKPKCTVDDTAKTVLACIAGVESYRTGRPVKVKKLEEIL